MLVKIIEINSRLGKVGKVVNLPAPRALDEIKVGRVEEFKPEKKETKKKPVKKEGENVTNERTDTKRE